jgi:hypothetical protein
MEIMKYCMAQNYKEVNGDYGERQVVEGESQLSEDQAV